MVPKIAAVVVLYNWGKEETENINSYSKYFDEIILVDNSDQKVPEWKNEKCHYIKLGDNFGIGYALNEGIKIAKNLGARYVVTMDQDSKFRNNSARFYKEIIENNDLLDEIVAPAHDSNGSEKNSRRNKTPLLVQSGAMFDIAIFDRVGMFNDELFIDVVDYEFAIRAAKNGVRIKKYTSVVLDHKPGVQKKKRIGFKTISFVSHNSNRLYYQARNLLWAAKKYKNCTVFKIYLRLLVKIVFLFDNKKRNLKMYIRGTNDAIHGRLGRVL